MSSQRIAIIFDNTVRSDTTGVHCRRALEQLAAVEHYRPTDMARIPRDGFDLYLNIDDGLRYRLPSSLHPSAWWAIDTHLDFDWYRTKAPDFDFVFTAQRDGAELLRREGIETARWLPLACNPELHRKQDLDKLYDVSFVGNLFPGPRSELIGRLKECFPAMFVGQEYGEAMARVYSQSRTVFNRSIRNDLNMRVFEALACGSLLVTNDLEGNGQEELFHAGEHLVVYRDAEDLVEQIRWHLAHEEERERIAAAGRQLVLTQHTYRHRMERILDEVSRARRPVVHRPAVVVPTDERPRSYFACSRPDLLALVPRTARRVLDVGCGVGAFGASLKASQDASVCGIELNVEAAVAARERLDEVFTGDVEEISLPFHEGHFDCIICGDVLEHLRDPQAFLRRARNWLAPEGLLVASIPNVRHHSVVGALLEGNWSYEPAGLLDRDHLHFFTRRKIDALLDDAGFVLISLDIVPGPGHEEWVRSGRPGEVRIGQLHLGGLPSAEAEEFFVYQYLITAAPRNCRLAFPQGTSEAHPTARILGCVLAVQNRPIEYLLRTLQTYAYQTVHPKDKVLVDYGSDPALASAYHKVCAQYGWRCHRMDPKPSCWNSSVAYNHAVAMLDDSVDVVFKNDVDVLLGADVLETALRLGRDRLCIFSCLATDEAASYPSRFSSADDLTALLGSTPPPKPMDGEGVHAFPRRWFEAVGGFDVDFERWGYEDPDLRLRADRSIGVVRSSEPILVHQWHPRSYAIEQVEKNRAQYERLKRNGRIVRNQGRLDRKPDWRHRQVEESVDVLIGPASDPTALGELLASIREHYPRVLVTMVEVGQLGTRSDKSATAFCQAVGGDARIVLHSLPSGTRPSTARKHLIEHSHAPYVLFLEEDFRFTAQTRLETFLAVLDSDEAIGVVGGRCLAPTGEPHPSRLSPGTLAPRHHELIHTPGTWRDEKRRFCDILGEFALVRRKVFQDIRWRGEPGAHWYDLFLQLRETSWVVCQEDSVSVHRRPRNARLENVQPLEPSGISENGIIGIVAPSADARQIV